MFVKREVVTPSMLILNQLKYAHVASVEGLISDIESKHGSSIDGRVQEAYKSLRVDDRDLGYPQNMNFYFPLKRSWSYHAFTPHQFDKMVLGLQELEEMSANVAQPIQDVPRPDTPPLKISEEKSGPDEFCRVRVFENFEVLGPGSDEIKTMLVDSNVEIGVSSTMFVDLNRWGAEATFGLDQEIYHLGRVNPKGRKYALHGSDVPEERITFLWHLFRRINHDQAATIKITRLFNQAPFNFMFGCFDQDFLDRFKFRVILSQECSSRKFHLYNFQGQDRLVIIYSGNIGRFFDGALGVLPNTDKEGNLGDFRCEAVINLGNNSAMVRTYAKLSQQGKSILRQLRPDVEVGPQSILSFFEID